MTRPRSLTFDGIRPSELARLTDVSKQAVSQSLAPLVEQGLVEYIDDPNDGRARMVRPPIAQARVEQRSPVGADLPVPLETAARAGARSLPLGHGELLGRLTQIFVATVQAFYVRRAAKEGAIGARTGAVTAVQRAGSDMRLNPHLHTIALDGTWSEQGNELVFAGLGHLKTGEVGDVLEHAVRRIERHLDRCGLLGSKDERAVWPRAMTSS